MFPVSRVGTHKYQQIYANQTSSHRPSAATLGNLGHGHVLLECAEHITYNQCCLCATDRRTDVQHTRYLSSRVKRVPGSCRCRLSTYLLPLPAFFVLSCVQREHFAPTRVWARKTKSKQMFCTSAPLSYLNPLPPGFPLQSVCQCTATNVRAVDFQL